MTNSMHTKPRVRGPISALIGAATLFGTAQVMAFDAFTLADYSGEELFGRFCASCHGEQAHGDGPVARSLNTVVPDLTLIRARYGEFPATLVRDTIDGRGVDIRAHGTRAMPVWGYEFWVEEGGDVTAQKAVRDAIAKLVDYLRSVQRDSNDAARTQQRH
jgi:mono/diheme cytochrome c family protein